MSLNVINDIRNQIKQIPSEKHVIYGKTLVHYNWGTYIISPNKLIEIIEYNNLQQYDNIGSKIIKNNNIISYNENGINVISDNANFIVVTDVLNVRNKPSLNSEVVTQYYEGEKLFSYGYCFSEGYVWRVYKSYDGYIRYIAERTDNKTEIYLKAY